MVKRLAIKFLLQTKRQAQLFVKTGEMSKKFIANEMEARYCQSCRMPLLGEHDFGTNKNGTKSRDYCTSCFKGGAFTRQCTMDEMVESYLEHSKAYALDKTEEQLRVELRRHFVNLKRWKEKSE